jgi:hypothetical protein
MEMRLTLQAKAQSDSHDAMNNGNRPGWREKRMTDS